MSGKRRRFSDTVKADTVRRHLTQKIPVSDLADELEFQPSVDHLWVKQVLDQAEKAFQRSKRPRRKTKDAKDHQQPTETAEIANTLPRLVFESRGTRPRHRRDVGMHPPVDRVMMDSTARQDGKNEAPAKSSGLGQPIVPHRGGLHGSPIESQSR